MKKKVIITAHDVGMSHSINSGIKYALSSEDNIFTELSLLPNAPGSDEAAELFKESDLPIHLCVTLTNYKPLSENLKTMVDKDGHFKSVDVGEWDFSSIDEFSEAEIRKEIDAQWDWFVRHVGKKPSAMVTQKGEHGDPKILIPFVEKARKEGVPIRSPYWKWKSNYAAQAYVEEEELKQTKNMIIACRSWKGRYGMDLNDIEGIIDKVNQNEGVTEIFVFCGFVDQELYELSSVNWQRGQYLHILKYQPEILRKLKEEFELIGYGDL